MCTAITFAIILVIHPSLSFNISLTLSSLHLYSDIVRVGSVSSWTVFIGSLPTIFLPAGSLYLRVNYECPSHMFFFIYESLALWIDLNSIIFWVFNVRFHQSFGLKLYFWDLFWVLNFVLIMHLWVLELELAVLPERKGIYFYSHHIEH